MVRCGFCEFQKDKEEGCSAAIRWLKSMLYRFAEHDLHDTTERMPQAEIFSLAQHGRQALAS